MGKLTLKKTDTPGDVPVGYESIFISSTGQPKKKDSEGEESPLAGISDAPINGSPYNRKDGEWVVATAAYQPSTLLASNTVPFDKDYIMGLTARTGNVLFDFTNAELGATSVMPHQDLAAFTIPTEVKQISGTYDGAVLNYLDFQLIDKTIGSEVVRLTISQIQP